MKLYNIKNPKEHVSLKTAVTQGLSADGGLFMPLEIPTLSPAWFSELPQMDFTEISSAVANCLLADEVPRAVLETIVREAFCFDIPLVEVEPSRYVLELFHGPTFAFKDFGARFMAHLVSYFREQTGKPLTILVATSGDTGSAVAQAFLALEGIQVVVLYPKGLVSELQEKQFATLGHNIHCLQVDGSFDDCQALVKQAFVDTELLERLDLTSANSINIARLIPQSFYFFHGAASLARARGTDITPPMIFSIPSGNFGNLTAGILAHLMGLPLRKCIAATNRNRVVPEYLKSGTFEPKPSVATIANAMDVGSPNNFSRLLEFFGHSHEEMSKVLYGCSFDDDSIREAIRSVAQDRGYILDPHTAIGYLGLKEYQQEVPQPGIVLGTAHPAKFRDVVQPLLPTPLEIPEPLQELLKKETLSIPLGKQFAEFKDYLLSAS